MQLALFGDDEVRGSSSNMVGLRQSPEIDDVRGSR